MKTPDLYTIPELEDLEVAAANQPEIGEEEVVLRQPCHDTASKDRTSSGPWNIFGYDYPRSEIVFFCQMVIIAAVISAAIYNLSTGAKDRTLWTALLSSSLGYILPNPSIRRGKLPE